jgi:acyl-CoA thioesterase-2
VTEHPASLPDLFALEQIDRDAFRARNADHGLRATLFGGQVAAQALLAAAATVERDRVPHSFHGYFLRSGRPDLPLMLQVDRDRDGRSFSARHVVAVQDGTVIFSMLASFHHERTGPVFDAVPTREAPEPEATPVGGWNGLLDVREVTPTDFGNRIFTDCVWVRSAAALGPDPLQHLAGLAYIADLGSGFGQQDRELLGMGGPSIDHAMWFQDPIRADEWVLIDLRPIKARAGRGVYEGSLRDREGRLGAILQQEALLLPESKPGEVPQ